MPEPSAGAERTSSAAPRARLLALAAATVAAAAPVAAAQPITLHSEGSRFTLRVAGIDSPERLNRLHGFDLAIAAADGRSVSGAVVIVTGRHRYAPNPLPTSPRVSPAQGAGDYRVEGLRFHVPGEWRLALEIEFEHIRDRATLDVVVK
jgi:hypothetical protein